MKKRIRYPCQSCGKLWMHNPGNTCKRCLYDEVSYELHREILRQMREQETAAMWGGMTEGQQADAMARELGGE